ncbi:MAG: glycoside hydrolase family 13 protein, partial [Clostridia bacterium]|nr:glycoside hydrolase family 13 protein [Clostridia bacterium]
GVAGFRLDVVDELPDVFLDPLCKAIKDCGDKVIIGEVWENATDKISYDVRRRYFQGGQLDSVMNYPLKDAIINYLIYGDGHLLKNVVLQQINNYPKDSLDKLFNLLSSHDTKRIVTALSNVEISNKDNQATFKLSGDMKEICKKKQLLAAVLQYTLYGVPCLFYGDEAGLEGFSDPFCRQCYPWGKEDRELIEFYRNLGNLRRDEVFVDSEVQNVSFKDGIFSFERKNNSNGYKILVNADKMDKQVQDLQNCQAEMGYISKNGVIPGLGFAILKIK